MPPDWKFFEKLSNILFVRRLMNPVWNECGDVEHDRWSSLRLFLLGYAFERQGRSPDYAPAAVDTIDEIRNEPLCAAMAATAWNRFAEKLNNEGLNHANNPMCPRGTLYNGRYRGRQVERRTTRKLSAVEFAAQLEQPLVAWARDLVRNGHVAEAHEQLCTIRGVDVKIAPLFLRDVVLWYNLAPENDLHLLHPVDTWVEFVVRKLSRNAGMTPASCANYIVEHANAPERANQGMWYFCVHVAGSSRYVVRRCLEDDVRCNAALDRHLANLSAGGAAAAEWNGQQ